MIDDVMYGMIPSAKTAQLIPHATREQVEEPDAPTLPFSPAFFSSRIRLEVHVRDGDERPDS